MATKCQFKQSEIRKNNPIFSPLRTTVETVRYGNNVQEVKSLGEAYELAKNSSGTIELSQKVYEPEKSGLPKGVNVLLFNDGEITGRYAKARVIADKDSDIKKLSGIAREAAFYAQRKKLYHAEAYAGLDHEFITKVHLLVEEGYENTLYNWLLNFQAKNSEYDDMYKSSKEYPEGDVWILSLPDYYAKGHEDGLALFDPDHNALLLCGMRYFGEHKKGTLTLVWNIANRNGFAACHGGMKRYNLKEGAFTCGVFGLSGSGKSTLTHNTHGGKFDISILHDDAYVIRNSDAKTFAIEPSYFDKMQDYPVDDPVNKYLLTVQNCGATLDDNGNVVLVSEDIRNGNGRAIKSKVWTKNRVNRVDEPVNAIIWLMKDRVLPPIVRLENPILASVMGATLATKRTTAERLSENQDINALVIEPYANPFRVFPLSDDYYKFKALFEERGIKSYILNTGAFLDKDIPKELTLELLEGLALDKLSFEPIKGLSGFSYSPIEGYLPNMGDENYLKLWVEALDYRLNFLKNLKSRDALPEEAILSLEELKKAVLL